MRFCAVGLGDLGRAPHDCSHAHVCCRVVMHLLSPSLAPVASCVITTELCWSCFPTRLWSATTHVMLYLSLYTFRLFQSGTGCVSLLFLSMTYSIIEIKVFFPFFFSWSIIYLARDWLAVVNSYSVLLHNCSLTFKTFSLPLNQTKRNKTHTTYLFQALLFSQNS